MIHLDITEIDIEQVLHYFSIQRITRRGRELQFSCPFPEHTRGDLKPSSNINTQTGQWHCFGCGRSGSLVSFVAQVEGITNNAAAKWLADSYGGKFGYDGSLESELDSVLQPEEAPLTNRPIPEEFLHIFDVDWRSIYAAYVEDRCPPGLSLPFRKHRLIPHSLIEHNIGFDERSMRITIPLRNTEGKLMGFKGRAISDNDVKYIGLGDKGDKHHYGFSTVKTHEYVWGIDTSDPDAILVEGEFDAINLRQRGYPAIALGGSNVSKHQCSSLVRRLNSVTTLFDPDEAGRKAERKIVASLLDFIKVEVARLPRTDPAESTAQEIEQALQNKINAIQIKEVK